MKQCSFLLLLGSAALLAAYFLYRGYSMTAVVPFLGGFVCCATALFLESRDQRPPKAFADYVGFSLVSILLFSFVGSFFSNRDVQMYIILGGVSGSIVGLLWFFTHLLRKNW